MAIKLFCKENKEMSFLEFLPYEPPHDKTNKMVCAPSEDSDQPGHPLSLITDPHEESFIP